MKIVSFGDSFVFGSELKDNSDGSKSWIAQCANDLGVDYETTSIPGCGNDSISRNIYEWFSCNDSTNVLAVINWTWASRWDYCVSSTDTWITVGPTCVPQKLMRTLDETQAHHVHKFYNDTLWGSLLWHKFRNLQTIYAAQSYLRQKNIKNIQTYMDYILFDDEWHCPPHVEELQDLVRGDLLLFEGKNFVDWSRDKGFEVTNTLHPLEDAHSAAKTLWIETYREALQIDK
jgi:hypothetical protein